MDLARGLGVSAEVKPVIELDGSRFKTLEEFYDHFEERALDCSWGKNLDAFNDVLRGGFGTPEKGFKLLWGRRHPFLSSASI